MRHICLLLLMMLAAASLLAFVGSSPALAHATLIESSPAQGSVLAVTPLEIRLRFNEPVSPLVTKLSSVDRASVIELKAESRNQDVIILTPAKIDAGTHVLSWRVVSSDGHPIAGALTFSIGAPSANPSVSHVEPEQHASIAIWLSRIGFYIGLYAGIGGAFFCAWIFPRGHDASQTTAQVIKASLATGVAGAISGLALQGLDALGERAPALFTSEAWLTGLGTAYGPTVVISIIGFALAFLSLHRLPAVKRALAGASMLLVGLALSLSGHASSAQPQWITRPAVFIHGLAVAYWIGALAPLALLTIQAKRDPSVRVASILHRFSQIAVLSVSILALTGVLLAAIQLEAPQGFLETAYGRVLIIKLFLVAALLALAAYNRTILTPVVAAEAAPAGEIAKAWLAKTISAELALALAIIIVASFWRFTPPPRALASLAAQPAIVHIHGAEAMADLRFSPGRVGLVHVDIQIRNGDFAALHAKEVTLFLSNPAGGVEEIQATAVKGADQSAWSIERVAIPLPGQWTVRVELLITDFKKIVLDNIVEIRP